jgi:antitoxin YefM
MKSITTHDFGNNLPAYLNVVCSNNAVLSVLDNNGRACVVMNESEYNGLLETMHLLSSVKNQRRLDEAIEEMRRGTSLRGRLSIE